MSKLRAQSIRLGVLGLAFVLSLFVTSFAASKPVSAATRTTCSATSPSYKEWQSTITYHTSNPFCIRDTNGAWVVWQSDGNLVWYLSGRAVWSSKTYNRGYVFKLQSDSNMVIYDITGKAIWASSWVAGHSGPWWSPGMTATGACKYWVSVYYAADTRIHNFSQGIGCGQAGALFWEKQTTNID